MLILITWSPQNQADPDLNCWGTESRKCYARSGLNFLKTVTSISLSLLNYVYGKLKCSKISINSWLHKKVDGQTVQTQIRLLLKKQSDQGLHCLLF